MIALDLDLQHLRRAQLRATKQVSVFAANAQQLPFADGAFDAVVLRMALSQMPQPLAAIEEALRVLKKGGFMSVIDQATRGRAAATVHDSAQPAADAFRETLLNNLTGRRDTRIDTERSLPRLFMLRVQKVK